MTSSPEPPRPAPAWDYPAELPVSAERPRILRHLAAHPVLILCGETGSGKSTQLPKLCLEAGRGQRGLIAHTQPRRIAARALAERIASELGEDCGQTVGWQVRFRAVTSAATRVKLMTDGLLLAELAQDRELRRYDTIIIDEAHERSLNIDFLLGYLKPLSVRRPELRIVITSATLDAERLSAHFDDAPVLRVAGRSHPIEIRYAPPDTDELAEAVAQAVHRLRAEDDGDVLVFLPGEREIRDCAALLARRKPPRGLPEAEVLPLFARLGAARQQRIFQPQGGRRIVLATNVAETSITVPGIRHVIDSGLARISRYNPRSKIQGLGVEPIARASADQRAGRCGRTGPGICLRLYDEADFLARPAHTPPEVQRTNLAAVVLRMAHLELGEPESFPFVDAPQRRYFTDARRLLAQLGALDAAGGLTAIGHQLAQLPVDPRLGRILLAAGERACLSEALILCAALAMPDPRTRDPDGGAPPWQAYQDRGSDFMSLLRLWQAVSVERHRLGSAAFRRWCRQQSLNERLLREWRDLVLQLGSEARRLGLRRNTRAADPAGIHLALLHGLLDHIGQHDEEGEYRGVHGRRFRIHPGSALSRRRPRWIFAAEIVSTSRTWARTVAAVDVEAIIAAAGPLLSREHLEPAWDPRRGEVLARERLSLFGLVLSSDRRSRLADSDPDLARSIFLGEALVRGRWGRERRPAFIEANIRRRKRIEAQEDRLRTRGLTISEEAQAAWYGQRLPATLCSRRQLERWLRRKGDGTLRMEAQDLLASALAPSAQDYPTVIDIAGQDCRLSYCFDPGGEEDGVSLHLPLPLLNQVDPTQLEWLVPGLLPRKVEALLRGLPRARRRALVPLPETVARCVSALSAAHGDLYRRLQECLAAGHRDAPGVDELRAVPLEPALQMRIVLLDGRGRTLASGRQLRALQQAHAAVATAVTREAFGDEWRQGPLSDWTIPDLPECLEQGRQRAWPRLHLDGEQVELTLFDDPAVAERAHLGGLHGLLWLAQKSRLATLRRSLPELRPTLLRLAARPAPDAAESALLDALRAPGPVGEDAAAECLLRAIADCQLDAGIRSADAFRVAIETGGAALNARAMRLWSAVCDSARALERLREAIAALPAAAEVAVAIRAQLAFLLPPGFVQLCPEPEDLPRYIQAMARRAEAARLDPAADARRAAQIAPWETRLGDALAACVRERQAAPAALADFRWLLEEYRVSVYAQKLGTRRKVSEKRMTAAWNGLD